MLKNTIAIAYILLLVSLVGCTNHFMLIRPIEQSRVQLLIDKDNLNVLPDHTTFTATCTMRGDYFHVSTGEPETQNRTTLPRISGLTIGNNKVVNVVQPANLVMIKINETSFDIGRLAAGVFLSVTIDGYDEKTKRGTVSFACAASTFDSVGVYVKRSAVPFVLGTPLLFDNDLPPTPQPCEVKQGEVKQSLGDGADDVMSIRYLR